MKGVNFQVKVASAITQEEGTDKHRGAIHFGGERLKVDLSQEAILDADIVVKLMLKCFSG